MRAKSSLFELCLARRRKEYLACYKMSNGGKHKAVYLDSDKVKDQQYVISVLFGDRGGKEQDVGIGFLQPILNEFESQVV